MFKHIRIVATKMFKDDARAAYVDTLRKAGRYALGTGSYAAVYEHPFKSGRVIKVTHGKDLAYKCFLRQLAKYGAPNKWLPNVHAVTIVVSVPDYQKYKQDYSDKSWYTDSKARNESSFIVCELDKLVSFDSMTLNRRMVSRALSEERAYEAVRGSYGHLRLDTALIDEGLEIDQDDEAAATLLSGLFKMHGPDLHHGNVMYKGEQLVFTDPCC